MSPDRDRRCREQQQQDGLDEQAGTDGPRQIHDLPTRSCGPAGTLGAAPSTRRKSSTSPRNAATSRAASRATSSSGSIAGNSSRRRSEEHTSELQSLMRISYAVFCLKTKKKKE